jgi:hypothetical protein
MSKEQDKAKQTLEPAAWGDPEGKGLLGRSDELDHVFETGERPAEEQKKEEQKTTDQREPEKKQEQQAKQEEKVDEKKTENPDTKKEEEKKTEEKSGENEKPDLKGLGEDFFSEEKRDEKSFDETAYDAQTDRIVKEMEKQGHPGEAYRELRQQNKDLLKQVQAGVVPPDVKKQLDEFKAKAEEAEGLRERLKEISKKDAQLQLESSDEYRNTVLAPVRQIMDDIKQIAQSYGVDAGDVELIVKTADLKERQALLDQLKGDASTAGLGVVGMNEVSRLAGKFNDLRLMRSRMLEEATERVEKMKVQEIETTKLQLEEHRKNVQAIKDAQWEDYKDIIPGLLDEDGNETPEMKKLRARVTSIDFSNARAKDQAFAAFSGVLFSHVVKELHEANKRLEKYEKKSERRQQAAPNPGDSVAKKVAEPEKADKPRRTLLQDMNEVNFAS